MKENPLKAIDAVYKFSLSNAAKLASVLSISIPYYLSGLSIAIAFRAGVFNIGNEGQYFVGGMVGALAGIYLHLPAGHPHPGGRACRHGRRRALGPGARRS